ncbi:hypothetical protein J7T55_004291 [Diaporthe amygdali]|uniref:uncharacterized protein n=1 Tax=Phomopsis amygdali TaxID=1214568 RepID=UPI0022FE730B|nr:uncharacterized protein J7T55_004291 [Diaporthe amygdali]KAJ0109742.1 hypothetical protein J7T55_004291 [Diaporthe amygdali]
MVLVPILNPYPGRFTVSAGATHTLDFSLFEVRDTSSKISTIGVDWAADLDMTFARDAAKAIGASDCSAPNGRPGQLHASATGPISWSQRRGRRVEPHWTGD